MPKGVPFPPEFRKEAVRLHRMSGRPLRATAQEIGVGPETLARWVRQAEVDEGRLAGLTTEEREELRRLRRENKLLRILTSGHSIEEFFGEFEPEEIAAVL